MDRLQDARRVQFVSYIAGIGAGVIATADRGRAPESAFINLAATPDMAIVFETLVTSRKYRNLQREPQASLVIAKGDTSLQIEGEVDEPEGQVRDELMAVYYAACPHNSAHRNWPGLTYLRLRPRWVRYSDYGMPWKVEEFLLQN